MKKTYEIELRRTSFITVYVEAQNEEEAEQLFWDDMEEYLGDAYTDNADWSLESIEEVKG